MELELQTPTESIFEVDNHVFLLAQVNHANKSAQLEQQVPHHSQLTIAQISSVYPAKVLSELNF